MGLTLPVEPKFRCKFNEVVEASRVRSFTEEMGYKGALVQSIGEDNEFLIRLESVKGKTEKKPINFSML